MGQTTIVSVAPSESTGSHLSVVPFWYPFLVELPKGDRLSFFWVFYGASELCVVWWTSGLRKWWLAPCFFFSQVCVAVSHAWEDAGKQQDWPMSQPLALF